MDQPDALRRLIDRDDIAGLIHAYCYHFDRNEPAAVAGLFTSDAVVDYGPEVPDLRGRAAILQAVTAGLRDTFAATSHHVSNIVISNVGAGPDGADRASSICYLYAWHRYRSGAPEGELWAQYHHDFVRQAEGWRIARLVLKAAGTRDFHRASMHPIGRA